MSNNQILTCAYCGQQYPEGTPATQHEELTKHIEVCKVHPLRAAEDKIKKLRSALSDFLGCKTLKELDEMEIIIRSHIAPTADKTIAINAINALRECI